LSCRQCGYMSHRISDFRRLRYFRSLLTLALVWTNSHRDGHQNRSIGDIREFTRFSGYFGLHRDLTHSLSSVFETILWLLSCFALLEDCFRGKGRPDQDRPSGSAPISCREAEAQTPCGATRVQSTTLQNQRPSQRALSCSRINDERQSESSSIVSAPPTGSSRPEPSHRGRSSRRVKTRSTNVWGRSSSVRM